MTAAASGGRGERRGWGEEMVRGSAGVVGRRRVRALARRSERVVEGGRRERDVAGRGSVARRAHAVLARESRHRRRVGAAFR